MFEYTKQDGTPCTRDKRALALRIMDVFRREGDTAASLSGEIKALTDKDKADFKAWFEDEGYPVL